MPGFDGALSSQFEKDLTEAADALFAKYVELVRESPFMPEDTGALARGVEQISQSAPSAFVREAVIASTTRSDEGADYGSILDTSRGQKILPVNKKALANTKTGWGPYASSHLTVKHVGWWLKVNTDRMLADAAIVLGRYGL